MLDLISTIFKDHHISGYIYTVFLVFCRVGGVISLLPGFGEQFIPARIKLFTALGLAIALYPLITPNNPPALPDDARLYPQIIGELISGAILGFWIRMIFMALTVAAGFCSQILGITNIFDASLEPGGAPALSGFFSFTIIALIFATGGHYSFIKAIVESYQIMPLLGEINFGMMSETIIDAGSTAIMLGLRIALPFLGVGFLINMGLGFVNRAMPQIPVFFVGQPLMIAAGFFLLSTLISSIMFNWSSTLESFLSEHL